MYHSCPTVAGNCLLVTPRKQGAAIGEMSIWWVDGWVEAAGSGGRRTAEWQAAAPVPRPPTPPPPLVYWVASSVRPQPGRSLCPSSARFFVDQCEAGQRRGVE